MRLVLRCFTDIIMQRQKLGFPYQNQVPAVPQRVEISAEQVLAPVQASIVNYNNSKQSHHLVAAGQFTMLF